MNKNKVILALVIITLCLANIAAYKNILPQRPHEFSHEKNFPRTIAGWTASDINYDKSIIAVLEPDVTVYRQYVENTHIPVTLFIAFYNTLEKSDLSHSPIVCFTGQGWEILSSNKKSISVGIPAETTIRINRLEQKHQETYMVTYYWYQSSKNAYSNRGIQKILLLMDKLMGKNEKNAFIRLTIQGPTKEYVDNSEQILEHFIKDFYPNVITYLSK